MQVPQPQRGGLTHDAWITLPEESCWWSNHSRGTGNSMGATRFGTGQNSHTTTVRCCTPPAAWNPNPQALPPAPAREGCTIPGKQRHSATPTSPQTRNIHDIKHAARLKQGRCWDIFPPWHSDHSLIPSCSPCYCLWLKQGAQPGGSRHRLQMVVRCAYLEKMTCDRKIIVFHAFW